MIYRFFERYYIYLSKIFTRDVFTIELIVHIFTIAVSWKIDVLLFFTYKTLTIYPDNYSFSLARNTALFFFLIFLCLSCYFRSSQPYPFNIYRANRKMLSWVRHCYYNTIPTIQDVPIKINTLIIFETIKENF